MKILATISVFCLVLLFGILPAEARRGNPTPPVPSNAVKTQFYIVDSDDNDPRAPTYNFVDTLFGTWKRVTGFTSADDGYGEVKVATDSFIYYHMDKLLRLPPRYYSTNGTVKLTIDTFYTQPMSSPANGTIPTGVFSGFEGIVCPLWADMEFRTTGDSSKVFYRMTTDSCYVTYYNLALKGTNGQVRATFQVAFTKNDSSITFNYRSFDGAFNSTPAALVFQNEATIGVENAQGDHGTMYLDRGTYYAQTYSSQLYAQPLHTSLAVKFIRVIPNFIRVNSIDFPPNDRYEMLTNSFTPKVTIENLMNTSRNIVINVKVTNLTTGSTLYNRTDSLLDVSFSSTAQFTGSLYQSFPCGTYRMTATVSVPVVGEDGWVPDNIMTRDFTYMGTQNVPFYDDFVTLNPCNWHSDGATWIDGPSSMFDPPSPRSTGAVILNRRDAIGDPYITTTGSDSITSAPINLAGKSNVWLTFSYQRGLSTDSMQAGIKSRSLVGPEPLDLDSAGTYFAGDSLIIEALPDTSSKFNPVAAQWAKIAVIYGGIDNQTRKFRMLLGTKYTHDHSRIRMRLSAKDDHLKYGFPIDDDDNWLIDGFQISAPTGGQTDLEPTNVDLGNGSYTHIPRNVKIIYPKVTIASNGLQTNSAYYNVHLVIKDALNRFVYDKTQSLLSPAPHVDTTMTMPLWDIQGSQGGGFTATVNLAQNFNEYRRTNDTNVFYRTMYIDDKYALDDGVPDTVGTMVVADNNWFYLDFTPLAADSLRGFEFFHLGATGNTNWTINILDTANAVLATRAFSYNALQRGLIRGTFTPFFLNGNTKYRLQCIMTQGFGLGGDASRGLMWESTHSFNAPGYTALYPNVVSMFRTSTNADYLSAKRNAAAGGPILPMARPIFAGSSTFLPVEIASFKGRRTDLGSVNLSFRTAKEENVDHFEIDRESSSGWVSAGSTSASNSRLGSDYAVLDEKAPSTSLVYRLMEVDLDGTRRLVGTTNVSAYGEPGTFSVRVYPNPTAQEIHVTINGNSDDVTLFLYDALGKIITTKEHVTSNSVDLDASSLSAGSYWLEARNGSTYSRIKVAVTK